MVVWGKGVDVVDVNWIYVYFSFDEFFVGMNYFVWGIFCIFGMFLEFFLFILE